MTMYDYLSGRKVLKTIKGNLVELSTTIEDNGYGGNKSYIQKFMINNTKIELKAIKSQGFFDFIIPCSPSIKDFPGYKK